MLLAWLQFLIDYVLYLLQTLVDTAGPLNVAIALAGVALGYWVFALVRGATRGY